MYLSQPPNAFSILLGKQQQKINKTTPIVLYGHYLDSTSISDNSEAFVSNSAYFNDSAGP